MGSSVRPRTADRAKFVNLVLEEIGIDGANPNSLIRSEIRNLPGIATFREIPLDVHRHAGTRAGHPLNFSRILNLLLDGFSRRRLKELAKARTRVRVAPARSFNLECVELRKKRVFVHQL